ncbi:mRNA-capping enzyme [Escovopsis weberi]|uniref:mRNA-capping enzyme n=1 Tax=Escovopsis weberi TaxID=150374 RepID=A0A0M8MX61_ESCWE|nr:mRNA-capping enzyme [Escovopsis weberi]
MAAPRHPPPPPGEAVDTDPHSTDPELLREHSQMRSYRTSRFLYPELRVFYRQHVKAQQLPTTPAPLPLLVFIPGLGGSVAQFHPLLRSLVDLAPCLALDWPGAGRSRFAPTSWEAYTSDALMELLALVVEDHRDARRGQGVVLIGHSMGTALAAGLATRPPRCGSAGSVQGPSPSTRASLHEHVVGLVAICPASGPLPESAVRKIKMLFWLPACIFSLWRKWDGRGGLHSRSVSRFVGADADRDTRIMQFRFNRQSRTPVWRRMAYGALPASYEKGKPVGGLPGPDAWAGLDIPVYLIAGGDDNVTPREEVDEILAAMSFDPNASNASPSLRSLNMMEEHEIVGDDVAAALSEQQQKQQQQKHQSSSSSEAAKGGSTVQQQHPEEEEERRPPSPDPITPSGSTEPSIPPQPARPPRSIKYIVLPSPANHALLYMPRTRRVLAGLVSDFLAGRVTQRLSLAWQLQHLSREGKWDVKNLLKWQGVPPVSAALGPAGAPVFRVLKTLREADDVHSPRMLVRDWGREIRDVVDISKDQPVYDPRGLERGGVHYHKFPTRSKVPPDAEQVEAFIRLVDSIRAAHAERAIAEGWADDDARRAVVGVHCHYGYNRSGYLVVCYLVERCGYALRDAIDEFARAKPSGIRHSHFLDKLHMRYDLEGKAS